MKEQGIFDRCMAELDKLTAEEAGLSKSIESLKAERNAAVAALAKGDISDISKRKVILGLEGKIADLDLSAEALGHLIVEARNRAREADEGLKEAEKKEDARRSAFLKKREQEEIEKWVASLPQELAEMCQLHQEICTRIGILNIKKQRLIDAGAMAQANVLEKFLTGLPAAIHQNIRDKGMRPLFVRGFNGDIVIWSLISNPPELSSMFPGMYAANGSGPIRLENASAIYRERDVKQLMTEYNLKK